MDLVYFLSAVYFYLPGAVANMGANFSRYIPLFDNIKAPIDGGRFWKGQRVVGEHKTWGGFLGGLFLGVMFGLLKVFVLDKYWTGYLFLNLNTAESIWLVFLLAFGALSGDIVKSIFKRLLNIPPHGPWIPFDEIDHSTMAMLLVKIFFGIEWRLIFTIVITFLVLHLLANVLAYILKLKKVPY